MEVHYRSQALAALFAAMACIPCAAQQFAARSLAHLSLEELANMLTAVWRN